MTNKTLLVKDTMILIIFITSEQKTNKKANTLTYNLSLPT